MLRVLSPDEQSCLTANAQALIYKYCCRNWLNPRQLEELITSVVGISRLHHSPADEELVTLVLHSMGEPDTPFGNDDDAAPGEVRAPRLS